jgi:hypothetical protein
MPPKKAKRPGTSSSGSKSSSSSSGWGQSSSKSSSKKGSTSGSSSAANSKSGSSSKRGSSSGGSSNSSDSFKKSSGSSGSKSGSASGRGTNIVDKKKNPVDVSKRTATTPALSKDISPKGSKNPPTKATEVKRDSHTKETKRTLPSTPPSSSSGSSSSSTKKNASTEGKVAKGASGTTGKGVVTTPREQQKGTNIGKTAKDTKQQHGSPSSVSKGSSSSGSGVKEKNQSKVTTTPDIVKKQDGGGVKGGEKNVPGSPKKDDTTPKEPLPKNKDSKNSGKKDDSSKKDSGKKGDASSKSGGKTSSSNDEESSKKGKNKDHDKQKGVWDKMVNAFGVPSRYVSVGPTRPVEIKLFNDWRSFHGMYGGPGGVISFPGRTYTTLIDPIVYVPTTIPTYVPTPIRAPIPTSVPTMGGVPPVVCTYPNCVDPVTVQCPNCKRIFCNYHALLDEHMYGLVEQPVGVSCPFSDKQKWCKNCGSQSASFACGVCMERYCSVSCQQDHWIVHQRNCKPKKYH